MDISALHELSREQVESDRKHFDSSVDSSMSVLKSVRALRLIRQYANTGDSHIEMTTETLEL